VEDVTNGMSLSRSSIQGLFHVAEYTPSATRTWISDWSPMTVLVPVREDSVGQLVAFAEDVPPTHVEPGGNSRTSQFTG
jgi:hypothetical protein